MKQERLLFYFNRKAIPFILKGNAENEKSKKCFFKQIENISTATIKKIYKSLEEMDARQLKSAYQIFKEFASQQKYADIKVDKNLVERKIAKCINELDNQEGTDLETFLNEMNMKYGSKK